VDCHSTGVRREALCDVIGARGSMMADIHFEDVTVGDDAIIGGEGMGLAIATGILDYGRLSVAAGSVGIVQACLDCSVDYAWPCSKDGRQIGDFQLIQELISKMSVAASAGRALVAEAALSKELGLSSTLLKTCIAKQFAATSAVQAANDAVQLHGAAGLTTRYPVERLLRDAKVMEIIEGSTQIQHGIIAEATRDALRQVGGVR
jgi:acyl-coA dehydrogenase domain protein